MSNTEISLIVPTHNRCDSVSRLLKSVASVENSNFAELIVVANCCSDDTVVTCENWFQKSKFLGRVVEEKRPGLNAARNRGVEESVGKLCVFLDDDVTVEPQFLNEVVTFFSSQDAAIAGGPAILELEPGLEFPNWFSSSFRVYLSESNPGLTTKELRGFSGIVGANFWVRRDTFDKIGIFRPGLDRCGRQLIGGGESDLTARAQRSGLAVYQTHLGPVKHWIPHHRLTPKYLKAVAYGSGRGNIRLRPKMDLIRWLRCLTGHCYLSATNGGRTLKAQLRRNESDSVKAQIGLSKAMGGLHGLLDRLLQDTPPTHHVLPKEAKFKSSTNDQDIQSQRNGEFS